LDQPRQVLHQLSKIVRDKATRFGVDSLFTELGGSIGAWLHGVLGTVYRHGWEALQIRHVKVILAHYTARFSFFMTIPHGERL
jgi:hypothetical protein